jgi:RNA-dependent RNA polymerase
MVILGAVIIYRNPCLDPGDLRIVQAVNRTELHEWTNVLLLPASKSCQRSLSSECSGGDLDGDQFSIIWDDRLIPPTHREFQPVDYADVLAVARKSHACPSELSEEEFLCKTMCNSFLGKIANMHLAISDQLLSNKANERYQ